MERVKRLKTPSDRSSPHWKILRMVCAAQVETILISVISMLADPNDESPANVDAAKEWREAYPEFKCVKKGWHPRYRKKRKNPEKKNIPIPPSLSRFSLTSALFFPPIVFFSPSFSCLSFFSRPLFPAYPFFLALFFPPILFLF